MSSLAVGQGASASGLNSSAFGQGASAGFANSTAIGALAHTTRDNQIAFGGAANTYTAAGITSAASLAAQSGTKQVVTSDANGNLATLDTNSLISNSSAFQNLQHQVHDNTEGIAMAMALGGGNAILPDDKSTAMTVNWGNFGNTNAMAVSGVQRLTDNIFLNGGVGVGTSTGLVGGRAGVSFAW